MDEQPPLSALPSINTPVPDQSAGGAYVYDWVGNRTQPPAGTTNQMVYNKADQLVAWPGMHGSDAAHSGYTYDRYGNLTTVKNTAATNILSSYTYTPDNLLDTATYTTPSGSHTLTNTWDATGNRVNFTVNGTTHSFVYDPTVGIPAVIQEDNTSYYREPDGEVTCTPFPGHVVNYQ